MLNAAFADARLHITISADCCFFMQDFKIVATITALMFKMKIRRMAFFCSCSRL